MQPFLFQIGLFPKAGMGIPAPGLGLPFYIYSTPPALQIENCRCFFAPAATGTNPPQESIG